MINSRIQEEPRKLFANTLTLQTIFLRNNHIHTIHPFAFFKLKKLSYPSSLEPVLGAELDQEFLLCHLSSWELFLEIWTSKILIGDLFYCNDHIGMHI